VRTFDELERMWLESPPEPRGRGAVRLLCVRTAEGVHECVDRVLVTPERGVEGDRWLHKPGRDLDQQVTLIRARVAELIAAGHAPIDACGDNLHVDFDLAEAALPPGARLRVGGALLLVTAHPHAGCKKFRARYGVEALQWVNYQPHRARRLRGVNCRVLSGGEVAVGDAIELDGEARSSPSSP